MTIWNPKAVVPAFSLGFYGDLFLSEADQGKKAMGAAATTLNDIAAQLSDEDAEFLAEAAEEAAAGLPEIGQPMAFNEVPGILQPVARFFARRIDAGLMLLFVSELNQVKRYLDEDVLASKIQQRVLDKITEETKVVVGHSLGSVVAYETIAVHKLRIPTLVTLGSPLGMKTVTKRLRAKLAVNAVDAGSPGVRSWTNIYDKADPVASAGALKRLWPGVDDWTVENDNEPHSIERYLNKKITGKTIGSATQ
ncbi:hypothetical protein BST12_24715 [Mycobacterium angelicum]|uniref:Alpha/beta hydrolase n=1 Tax=Mycobacterium angelicum TaxID=470074 RepID=A0A1W9ZDQ5_MYCAN|nr:hypothetical protein BST12_24715 [Mycobacterium angelicum]